MGAQLILVNVESDAFERSKNTAFTLYTKYQTQVHRDPPNDITEFLDFLCNSPIKVSEKKIISFF